MWAEAFRSVEDIQHLIALGKRQPKQQMMATYYSRLTQIFAVSESHLYHAYAWLKLFNFSRTYNKNLTPRDQQMMATSVVLATMSILPYDRALFGRQDEQQVGGVGVGWVGGWVGGGGEQMAEGWMIGGGGDVLLGGRLLVSMCASGDAMCLWVLFGGLIWSSRWVGWCSGSLEQDAVGRALAWPCRV
jgi:hypothetical protein